MNFRFFSFNDKKNKRNDDLFLGNLSTSNRVTKLRELWIL